MHTLSLDLRERILRTYDEGRSTRAEVAKRFRVSLGMVKKLLCQRLRLGGDLRPQHHRSGRKAKILPRHRERWRARLARQPDLTLAELRRALRLECSLPAIHYALQALGLSYKKRRSDPASRTAPTSPKPGASGKRARPGSIPRGSSSWTNPVPPPISPACAGAARAGSACTPARRTATGGARR